MPTVSVIMPAYRVSGTILAAVDSVLEQSFADFELLVVNDGCPEHSGFLAESRRDPRVRVIDQANRGLAGARNTGILAARGEYIAFIDSDDLWEPRKLEQHVALLRHDASIGVSYSASALIDDAGKAIGLVQQPRTHGVSARDVFCRNPVGNGSAPVIRRETLDDIAFHCRQAGRRCYFDESFRQSEDIECWVRIALSTTWRFQGIEEPLTLYRIAASGLSADVIRQFESWERMVESARRIDPEFVARHENRARAYQLRYLTRRLVRMRDDSFAITLLGDALRQHPLMLIEEPRKTITTIGACVLLRMLSESWYERLEHHLLRSAQATT